MGAFCDLEINPLRLLLKGVDIPFALIVHVNTERYVINPDKTLDLLTKLSLDDNLLRQDSHGHRLQHYCQLIASLHVHQGLNTDLSNSCAR